MRACAHAKETSVGCDVCCCSSRIMRQGVYLFGEIKVVGKPIARSIRGAWLEAISQMSTTRNTVI